MKKKETERKKTKLRIESEKKLWIERKQTDRTKEWKELLQERKIEKKNIF